MMRLIPFLLVVLPRAAATATLTLSRGDRGFPGRSQTLALLRSYTNNDSAIDGVLDWKAASARLRTRGAPMLYRTGNSSEPALDPLLKSALSGLKQDGEVRLLDVAGVPHALKLTGRETLPPKPLDEVRGQIAQSLAALALRQALAATAPKVLADSNVVYLQDP